MTSKFVLPFIKRFNNSFHNLSSRKLHTDKLTALQEGRELGKFNPLPHRDQQKVILDDLSRKRQRNTKQHETETVSKNMAIMRENQILLSKLVEIVGRKKSICLPEVNDKKSRTSTSWS